jgi:muconolactone D-isomerase
LEFLVRFETVLPPDLDPEAVGRLKSAERDRAMQLRAEGVLRRLWRVPGRRAVVGLWEAPDATVLHEALSSLPQFPWMDVEVEPLATHPQEADTTTRERLPR